MDSDIILLFGILIGIVIVTLIVLMVCLFTSAGPQQQTSRPKAVKGRRKSVPQIAEESMTAVEPVAEESLDPDASLAAPVISEVAPVVDVQTVQRIVLNPMPGKDAQPEAVSADVVASQPVVEVSPESIHVLETNVRPVVEPVTGSLVAAVSQGPIERTAQQTLSEAGITNPPAAVVRNTRSANVPSVSTEAPTRQEAKTRGPEQPVMAEPSPASKIENPAPVINRQPAPAVTTSRVVSQVTIATVTQSKPKDEPASKKKESSPAESPKKDIGSVFDVFNESAVEVSTAGKFAARLDDVQAKSVLVAAEDLIAQLKNRVSG